ncbi:peptidylprolyl isomerase [Sulfurimonas lithotrophica]|uniref:Peptidylprolyl isomerase n=1 Tax=Sulfurimonas lithotrophica TaxID=2590022 RepID=A0A5P8P1G5_9BACT|nr:SurA N-terminal domain-containing protein [Sulfurimonas lithotrophica]QFR49506.1 peptidylprolyl isomerase [Sulfurimonas lithotrophica]
MITWMQRHKKYLIITIWISTIAFVGAGFVGWGQYSYGDKAGAVAKVGEIEVSMGDLQKAYSRLYNQYNKMFQGNFDEEKAKSFGLQKQALQQLIDQSLILNLASDYDLSVNDEELLDEIKSQEFFFKDGVFSKEVYKTMLSRNNLTMKDYEKDVKKQLLIQKVLILLPVKTNENENKILSTILSIADKIDYKVLSDEQISIDTSDKMLKPYWEGMKQNFMNEVSYDINYIKHDANTSKKDALRTYIDFKKSKLSTEVKTTKTTISKTTNPFDADTLEKISNLTLAAPFMKPVEIDGIFYTVELVKVNQATPKSYEDAKEEVKSLYVQEQKRMKLQELANNSYATFKGTTTKFVTQADALELTKLHPDEAKDFLSKLFTKQEKRGFVDIGNGKIVLYNILEQKMLNKSQQSDTLAKLKSSMFSEGLINNLQSKYKTEIFIEGL